MPTIVTSRNPMQFLRRHGIAQTPRRSNPAMDTAGLKINVIPLTREQLNPALMLDAQGSPPPDRGQTMEWPPSQEVFIDGSANGGQQDAAR